MKIQSDPRGKISSGKRNPESGMPMKLSYFDISDFPELEAVYGKEPADLLIFLPSNNASEFFTPIPLNSGWVKWGGKTGKDAIRVRTCDKTFCTHRIDETILGQKYAAGEISDCICDKFGLIGSEDKELKKKACAYRMYFKANVTDKQGRALSTMPITFESGSPNTANAIYSAIQGMERFTAFITDGEPHIALLPFRLHVRMASSSKRANETFPVWDMYPPRSLKMINDRMISAAKMFGWGEEFIKALQASTEGKNLLDEHIPEENIDQRPVVDEPPVDETYDEANIDPSNPLGVK